MQGAIDMNFKSIIEKHLEQAILLRHKIHQFPELGFEEFETAKTIISFLEKYKIPYKANIAKTGIIATIEGAHVGKTVLLRADMDGLAIDEDPSHALKSLVANKMHACGHDGHTAGLALAGVALHHIKDKLHGKVLLMFQPAEENFGGALPMIQEGVLQNVDAAFGCHLMGHIVENEAHTMAGAIMAAPDEFSITVIGKGGHGGMPHTTIDPILVGAHIILGLQSIVSRFSDPFVPVVVSIGQVYAGSAFNVIPDTMKITGTVRTLNEITRLEVENKIKQISTNIASSFYAKAEVEYIRKYPVLVNDEAMVELAKRSFSKVLSKENVHELSQPMMGGEDFAFIAKEVPSAFVFVGIAKDIDHPVFHHHPSFEWDDKNIAVLAEGLAQIAWDFLNETK